MLSLLYFLIIGAGLFVLMSKNTVQSVLYLIFVFLLCSLLFIYLKFFFFFKKKNSFRLYIYGGRTDQTVSPTVVASNINELIYLDVSN